MQDILKRIATITGLIATTVALTACASSRAVPRPRPFPEPAAPHEPIASPTPPVPTTPASLAPEVPAGGRVDWAALVETALSLRGTPYRNGGSDLAGFDCSGFTQYVFAKFGLPLPREVREQFTSGIKIKLASLVPGDLLFFSTTSNEVSHVGIALGDDRFVHAPSSTGVVRVESLKTTYWSKRFVGARRIETD